MAGQKREEESSPARDCERVLGHRFRDPDLLSMALAHASGSVHPLKSNERLEFLGDAILGAVVCEHLYEKYPDYQEGDLTRIKSHLVSRRTCAKVSRKLGLGVFLVLGKGMGNQQSAPLSVLANVYESVVGAIYLDGGLPAAREFVIRTLGEEFESTGGGEGVFNPKSQLQQLTQKVYGETPHYVVLEEKGPDHSKCFKVTAQVGEKRYGPAWGGTKKDAEQRAAENAFNEITGEAEGHWAH